MIKDMKKFVFLVTDKEYDSFICDIRALGVVHVDELQHGATSQELQSNLEKRERITNAKKSLCYASEMYKDEADACNERFNFDKSADGMSVVSRVESLLTEENKVKHEYDAAIDAVDQLAPFGEFSWDSIHALEQTGLHPYFYSVNSKLYKAEWTDKYYATPVGEFNKKLYFVAFASGNEMPDITAERLFLPDRSLSSYIVLSKEKGDRLHAIHAELFAIASEQCQCVDNALASTDDDIQLSKVHLSHEDMAGGAVKLLVGWTLAENAQDLICYLDKNHFFYEVSDPEFDDDVPIKIENNKFATLFEPILRMYSLPNYHDIDPLPFFAPFFMLFFGLCMGDLGYGMIIAAVSLAVIKMKPEVASFGKLGVLLGGMTMVCGFVTGSFFGINLATVDWEFMKPLQPYFINDSMKDSFFGYSPMMVISIIIGLIQVLLGMTMAGCKAVKNYGFIYGVGKFSWVVLLLSATVLYGFPLFGAVIASGVKYVLYALMCVSIFGIYFLNNPSAYKKPKAVSKVLGLGSNIGAGLWATYGNATGLLGDLLSYIRLFALGLTGGVLGGVFNTLAMDMSPQIPVVHEIVMLIILLFGHGINFALCMISSFVHPMRLTFVEYFKNAEFDGNGNEYKPFASCKAAKN